MLVGFKRSPREELFDKMELSSWRFYLTGSRYFGTQREDSDYDFFVEEGCYPAFDSSKDLPAWGFEPMLGSYTNNSILACYHHPHANVHVQVVIDAAMKRRAQGIIKLMYPCPRLLPSKGSTALKLLWKAALGLAARGVKV